MICLWLTVGGVVVSACENSLVGFIPFVQPVTIRFGLILFISSTGGCGFESPTSIPSTFNPPSSFQGTKIHTLYIKDMIFGLNTC